MFFFISESTKIDYEHSAFSIFRCIDNIKYFIDTLLANLDDLVKFYQIYIMNSTQKQLKRRLSNNIDDNVLDAKILLMLQRLIKDINLYARAFKSCAQRIANDLNFKIKIYLK